MSAMNGAPQVQPAAEAPAAAPPPAVAKTRVWDLPTRLFHWTLAVLVVFSFTTGKIGGNAMTYHMWSGYAILSLLLFRLLWGFAGSRYARFATFVRGPRAVLEYLRSLAQPAPRAAAGPHSTGPASGQAGHSPLGALAVVAMLAVLLTQASTGLFANDEIFTEGPLAKFVSGSTSALATTIHRYNEWVIVALVVLHLCAIAFYYFVRRDNLVGAMIGGDKKHLLAEPCADDVPTRLRALVLLAICAGVVSWIVNR